MRVRFDLRPATLLEKERKRTSFNSTRLVAMLLFLMFAVANGYYIYIMTMKMFELSGLLEEKTYEVDNLENGKNALQAEVNRLKKQESEFAATLKIMQDDLPTLEVLNALESCLEPGMGLSSLKFTVNKQGNKQGPVTAAVDATASTDEQTVRFSEGLTASGVFSTVAMPSSKLDDRTGRVSFTMSLTLLPIGQIKSAR